MEITITPHACWFVEGSHQTEKDLEECKRSHPEFVEWRQEWFQKEFVETGEFLLDDFSSYGGGGSLLLFKTEAAAKKYSARDPVIASGLRSPISALYVDLGEIRSYLIEKYENLNDGQIFDSFNEVFWDVVSSDGGLAGFDECSIVVFENSEKGVNTVNQLEARLQNLSSEFASKLNEEL